MSVEQLAENTTQELRSINHLIYLKPSNGSLIDKRTMKSYNFSNSSYEMGRTAQCIINSGGDYLWGPSSYLLVKFTKGSSKIGKGNILNIIQSLRLTHRSGEVLEYIQDYNVLGRIMTKYMVSNNDATKIDSLLSVPDAAGDFTCCIPLWMLLGIFGNDSQYIPGGFLAGGKLELILESNVIAFSEASAGGISKVDFNIVLDSSQVYDDIQKQIMEQMADVGNDGIQFTYSTYFSTYMVENSGNVNFDIQQSAAITESAFSCIRVQTEIAEAKESFDLVAAVTRYQYRLGSQYFPQAPVTASATNVTEPYLNTLIAFEAAPHQYMGCPANSAGSNVTTAEYIAGNAVYATTLEKSAAGLTKTGEPTNNSRILNLELEKEAASHRVNVFLKYIRVANIMGSNLVVDR
jgi:hypothetical protein